ncbi:MAG: hypothetical protein GY805_16635 [Chloroflexi bacterium]|nr:hypothetical protein [Chloroflexota bacterium]
MLENQIIQDWSHEDLIREVWHELNQKSSIALSISKLLADEEIFGFTSDKQKEIILLLLKQTKQIREVTDWISIWFKAHPPK